VLVHLSISGNEGVAGRFTGSDLLNIAVMGKFDTSLLQRSSGEVRVYINEIIEELVQKGILSQDHRRRKRSTAKSPLIGTKTRERRSSSVRRLRRNDPSIQKKAARGFGTKKYCFKHALMRETAYALLLRKQRHDIHLEAAIYFEDKLFLGNADRKWVMESYFDASSQRQANEMDQREAMSIIQDAELVASHFVSAGLNFSAESGNDDVVSTAQLCANRAIAYLVTAALLFEELAYIDEPLVLFSRASELLKSLKNVSGFDCTAFCPVQLFLLCRIGKAQVNTNAWKEANDNFLNVFNMYESANDRDFDEEMRDTFSASSSHTERDSRLARLSKRKRYRFPTVHETFFSAASAFIKISTGRGDEWDEKRTFHGCLDKHQERFMLEYAEKANKKGIPRVHRLNALSSLISHKIASGDFLAALDIGVEIFNEYDFFLHHALFRKYYGSDWAFLALYDARIVALLLAKWDVYGQLSERINTLSRQIDHPFTIQCAHVRLKSFHLQSMSMESVVKHLAVAKTQLPFDSLGRKGTFGWYDRMHLLCNDSAQVLRTLKTLNVCISSCDQGRLKQAAVGESTWRTLLASLKSIISRMKELNVASFFVSLQRRICGSPVLDVAFYLLAAAQICSMLGSDEFSIASFWSQMAKYEELMPNGGRDPMYPAYKLLMAKGVVYESHDFNVAAGHLRDAIAHAFASSNFIFEVRARTELLAVLKKSSREHDDVIIEKEATHLKDLLQGRRPAESNAPDEVRAALDRADSVIKRVAVAVPSQ